MPASSPSKQVFNGCDYVRLLLVNDEFVQLTMLEYHMKKAFNGSHVTTFTGINGADALKAVKRNLMAILRTQTRTQRKFNSPSKAGSDDTSQINSLGESSDND